MMLGSQGISLIVYELLRELEDRIRMQYEDDITTLRRELEASNARWQRIPEKEVKRIEITEQYEGLGIHLPRKSLIKTLSAGDIDRTCDELLEAFMSLEEKYDTLLAQTKSLLDLKVPAEVRFPNYHIRQALSTGKLTSRQLPAENIFCEDSQFLQSTKFAPRSVYPLNTAAAASVNSSATCTPKHSQTELPADPNDEDVETVDRLPKTSDISISDNDTQGSINLYFSHQNLVTPAPRCIEQATTDLIKKRVRTKDMSITDHNLDGAENVEDQLTKKVGVSRSSVDPHLPGELKKKGKFIETVRSKSLREVMPGHTCQECKKYYAAMIDQGMDVNSHSLQSMLDKCSRHKGAVWEAPPTPEGFWDLSVTTPEDWKRSRQN
jgi:hypothetical protein